MEEAMRLAEEMKRKQMELEMRLRFNRSLQLESNGLSHTQVTMYPIKHMHVGQV